MQPKQAVNDNWHISSLVVKKKVLDVKIKMNILKVRNIYLQIYKDISF